MDMLKVLILDDNDNVLLDRIAHHLRNAGYEVSVEDRRDKPGGRDSDFALVLEDLQALV